MIVLETERLQIREFTRDDTRELSRILGDPPVMEFSSKGPLSEADTETFIDWCIRAYQEHGHGQWAVTEKRSGELIGCCGLSHTTVDGTDEIEIGYRLAQDRWGKGLASEAANGVIGYGFSACNIGSIIGIVSPRHAASRRVLDKNGFHPAFKTHYSGWDVLIYRLNKQDWR